MFQSRVAKLVRRYVCASLDLPKLSPTMPMPNTLKKVSIIEDTEKWFKVALKHILSQAKIPGAGKVGVNGHTFRLQPFLREKKAQYLAMLWFVEPDRDGRWSAREVESAKDISLSDPVKGAQEVFSEMVSYFAIIPMIQHSLEAVSVLESVTGYPFKITYQNYQLHQALVEYKGGSQKLFYIFEVYYTLGQDPQWKIEIIDREARTQTEFENLTLEQALEHVPEEADSELLWFSNTKRAKEMTQKLEKALGAKVGKWALPPAKEVATARYIISVGAHNVNVSWGSGKDLQYVRVVANYMDSTDEWNISLEGDFVKARLAEENRTLEALTSIPFLKDVLIEEGLMGLNYDFTYAQTFSSIVEGFEEMGELLADMKSLFV